MKTLSIRIQPVVRVLSIVAACGLAAALAISPAQASRPDFGVRGGTYTDSEDPFFGAEAVFGLGGSQQWFGNPNLEHAFADQNDLTAVSFDFHYDFPTGRAYTIWAGGGPTMLFRDRETISDDTDAGVNLLFGVGAKRGEVRPYGQMKVIVADDTQAVLGAGVRF